MEIQVLTQHAAMAAKNKAPCLRLASVVNEVLAMAAEAGSREKCSFDNVCFSGSCKPRLQFVVGPPPSSAKPSSQPMKPKAKKAGHS